MKPDARRICQWFGVTPAQGSLLNALYQAAGKIVSVDELIDAASLHPFVGPRTITVQVCHIRKVIGRDGIENQWGAGYRLTEDGLEAVRKALAA